MELLRGWKGTAFGEYRSFFIVERQLAWRLAERVFTRIFLEAAQSGQNRLFCLTNNSITTSWSPGIENWIFFDGWGELCLAHVSAGKSSIN